MRIIYCRILQNSNLEQVTAELSEAYDALGISTGRFSILKHSSMPSESSKLPFLKGNGGALKQMTKALQIVFELHGDKAKPLGCLTRATVAKGHNLIKLSCKYSLAIDSIIDRNIDTNKLADAEAAALVSASFGFAQTQTALIKLFHPVVPVFHYTMKMHYLLNIALVSKCINPSIASRWKGEDMMKVVKRLV